MGIEDRDWARARRPSPRRWPGVLLVAALLAGLAVFVHGKGWSDSWKVGGERGHIRPTLGFGFGPQKPHYASGDRWKSYLAPESVCPGGEDRDAPAADQVRTMLCLIDYARRVAGLRALPENDALTRAATLKGEDVIRCKDFNHNACGKDPRAVANDAGYPQASWGENLYVASGPNGAPRPALDGWLNSDGHRENLLRPSWTEQGVALLEAKHFDGGPDAALWVSEFGAR